MAYEEIHLSDLDELSGKLRRCAQILTSVAADKRLEGKGAVLLQLDTLRLHVVPRLEMLVEKLEIDATAPPARLDRLRINREKQLARRRKQKAEAKKRGTR